MKYCQLEFTRGVNKITIQKLEEGKNKTNVVLHSVHLVFQCPDQKSIWRLPEAEHGCGLGLIHGAK